eukprot:620605-Amphidinium_carterae.2
MAITQNHRHRDCTHLLLLGACGPLLGFSVTTCNFAFQVRTAYAIDKMMSSQVVCSAKLAGLVYKTLGLAPPCILLTLLLLTQRGIVLLDRWKWSWQECHHSKCPGVHERACWLRAQNSGLASVGPLLFHASPAMETS